MICCFRGNYHEEKGYDKICRYRIETSKSQNISDRSGVIIGTVCIILMVAVGFSGYRQFEENFLADQSLTEITVTDYSQGGGIRDSVIRSMGTVSHVKTVSPVIELPVTVFAGKYTAVLQVKGIDPEAIDVTYEDGGVFESGAAIPSLVCGGNTMQSYIDPENPPDYTDYEAMETYRPDIDLMETELTMILGNEPQEEETASEESREIPLSRRYRVRVAGITEQSYSESSYDTYMDLTTARQILRENRELARYLGIEADSYTTVKIIVDEMEHVEEVLGEIKSWGMKHTVRWNLSFRYRKSKYGSRDSFCHWVYLSSGVGHRHCQYHVC